jgi:RNA polymerase sigma-70 factor (ECF subfamily)
MFDARVRKPELRVVREPDVDPQSSATGDAASPALKDVDWAILMAHAQAGDAAAYRRLLTEVTPYLRSLAAAAHQDPLDIEDTVQDTLLSVHSVRHTYDPARPFGAWLFAIAQRRIVDRLRTQRKRRSHETPITDEHEAFAAPAASSPEDGLDARAIRDAIGRLPMGQRDAIRLLKLQEMSLREASTATGLTVAALKVATHRGLRTLRRLVGQSGGEQR